MELIDLVDDSGNVLRTVERTPEARYGDGHVQIVVVVVERDGMFLVHERGPGARRSGLLDHAGGAVSSGEDWETAARREVREEVGVQLDEMYLVREGLNSNGRWQYLVAARTKDDPRVTDHDEVAWAVYMLPQETETYRRTNSFDGDLEQCAAFLRSLPA